MGTQKVTQDGCKAFKYRLIYILRVSRVVAEAGVGGQRRHVS
jgi:hypothetical protein